MLIPLTFGVCEPAKARLCECSGLLQTVLWVGYGVAIMAATIISCISNGVWVALSAFNGAVDSSR